MFRFIWNNKINNKNKVTEKVKREYLCKNKEAGGLGMIDLAKMQDSFYLNWAGKLLSGSNASSETHNQLDKSWKAIPVLAFSPVII